MNVERLLYVILLVWFFLGICRIILGLAMAKRSPKYDMWDVISGLIIVGVSVWIMWL